MKRTIPTHQHKSFHATYFITMLLLGTLLCLSTACNKDDDGPDNPYGLPNATESGANTFGCLINGEPWVAKLGVFAPGLHEIVAYYDEENEGVSDLYGFNIGANYLVSSKDSAKAEIFGIHIMPIYNSGLIDFSDLTRKDADFYTELLNVSGTTKHFELDTLYDNFMDVTKLDTVKNIFSAVFDLRLIRSNSSEVELLTITQGRFDVTYNQQ
jgi:hypothetical protein